MANVKKRGPGRLLDALDRVIFGLISAIYAVIVIAMAIQVFMRYVINAPFSWSEELARYMFIWLVYLGAYVAVIRNAHVGVDYLTRRFTPAFRIRLNAVLSMVIIATLAFIGYHAVLLGLDNAGTGWFTIEFLPMAIPYGAVPIGCALMILGFMRLLLGLGPRDAETGQTEAI